MARSIFGLTLVALVTLSLPAQAASVSANYKLAPSHAGDEDLVTAFDFYDLAVGASVIKAVAGNTGSTAGLFRLKCTRKRLSRHRRWHFGSRN